MAKPRWESIRYHTRTQPQSPTRSHPPLPLNRGYGGIHRLDRSSFIRTQPQNLGRRLWHHHHRDRLPRMLQDISLFTAYDRTVCSGLARNLTRHVVLGSLMTSDSHQLLRKNWLRDIPYEHSGGSANRPLHLSLGATKVGPSKHGGCQLTARIDSKKNRPHSLTSPCLLCSTDVTLNSYTATMWLTVTISGHLFHLTVHGGLPI